MRRLHYAGGSLLTADRTCKALLRYARALAEANTADVVSIPVVQEGGGLALAHFLIGPASQMYSTPVLRDGGDEPASDDLVRELESRTVKLQPSRPAWPDEMPDVPDFDFPDI